MRSIKKLYLVFALVIFVLGLIFYKNIKQALSINIKPETMPLVSEISIDLLTQPADQMLGNPGAPMTLVAFINLGDSASKKLYRTLSDFVPANAKDVRFIWKDAPKSGIISSSALGHEAAYCAGKQNLFWKYVETVVGGRYSLSEEYLKQAAESVGLDINAWTKCLSDPSTSAVISESAAYPAVLGLKAPALFINNKRINLDSDIDLEQMLNSLIQK